MIPLGRERIGGFRSLGKSWLGLGGLVSRCKPLKLLELVLTCVDDRSDGRLENLGGFQELHPESLDAAVDDPGSAAHCRVVIQRLLFLRGNHSLISIISQIT